MLALIRKPAPILMILSVFMAGCAPEGTLLTEPDIPSFALEAKWDGRFNYEFDAEQDFWRCFYTDSTDGTQYQFECGKLLLGLKAGVTPEDIQDLFNSINATFLRTSLPEPYTFASVTVPMRTEREALLTAAADSRLRYASLNFSGPAWCEYCR